MKDCVLNLNVSVATRSEDGATVVTGPLLTELPLDDESSLVVLLLSALAVLLLVVELPEVKDPPVMAAAKPVTVFDAI